MDRCAVCEQEYESLARIRLAHGSVIAVCDHCIPNVTAAYTFADSCRSCQADLGIGGDEEPYVVSSSYAGALPYCELCLNESLRDGTVTECVVCARYFDAEDTHVCERDGCTDRICRDPDCIDIHQYQHAYARELRTPGVHYSVPGIKGDK